MDLTKYYLKHSGSLGRMVGSDLSPTLASHPPSVTTFMHNDVLHILCLLVSCFPFGAVDGDFDPVKLVSPPNNL